MNTLQVDRLNTVLIFFSFWAAYHFPFELFVIVYAVLGPLHYLTEINWIRDKKYFTSSSRWAPAMVIFALIISLPFLAPWISETVVSADLLELFRKHNIILLPIAFLVAFLLITPFSGRIKAALFAIGAMLALLSSLLPAYQIIIGVFLPTVIHVYLFTILFMWHGTVVSGKKIGYFNISLMIFLPLFLTIMPIDTLEYKSQNLFKSAFLEGEFYALNVNLAKVLGFGDGTQFSFWEKFFIKVQIFITFAYTYHYLNWFSKTTVIGWHRQLNTKKSILIATVWLGAVALYFYNYKAGVAVVLFLSILHVLMEFPLNIITIRSVFGKKGTNRSIQQKNE